MAELTIEAKLDKLASVINFVNAQFTDKLYNENALLRINIAVEELFVNIARYAYPNQSGSVTVQIDFKNRSQVHITFIDSGIPFNPLEQKDPDITLTAQQRRVGGLGIFMVKKSMDSMQYEYTVGQNRLTIVKTFADEEG